MPTDMKQYMKNRRALAKRLGICQCCTKYKVDTNTRRCRHCKEAQKKRRREIYIERTEQGLCGVCHSPLDKDSVAYCSKHLSYNREIHRKRVKQ